MLTHVYTYTQTFSPAGWGISPPQWLLADTACPLSLTSWHNMDFLRSQRTRLWQTEHKDTQATLSTYCEQRQWGINSSANYSSAACHQALLLILDTSHEFNHTLIKPFVYALHLNLFVNGTDIPLHRHFKSRISRVCSVKCSFNLVGIK